MTGPRGERQELEGTAPTSLASLLEGSGRALAVWRLLREGRDPFGEAVLPSGLGLRLRETTRRVTLELSRVERAACGTRKLAFVLEDGRTIETVLIPGMRRTTVCISSQSGCARGCIFCVTATMGLERGLTTGEMTGQVVRAFDEAERAGLPPVRNVVFMGMGEPLDNFDAVRDAVGILCDARALAIAPRHVTLSTVGTSPEAIGRTRELPAPVKIAWSVHAVDDTLRKRLVPTARHRMAALRDAFLERMVEDDATLFVEMTLMEGVNDAAEHAEALAGFLAPFPRARVNLLPMNPGREGLEPSSEARALAFRQRLRERGYFCAIRRPRGVDASAACGQLARLSHRART